MHDFVRAVSSPQAPQHVFEALEIVIGGTLNVYQSAMGTLGGADELAGLVGRYGIAKKGSRR
ncbi:MAG TPA: hypothetical protein VGZ47_17170 [Gemmataceae bacterium]|jgi:hypothetical protein|nr:hypothetical protein [Gemmataceae bacterium]